MLVHGLRRWPNNKSVLDERLMLVEKQSKWVFGWKYDIIYDQYFSKDWRWTQMLLDIVLIHAEFRDCDMQ